MTARGHLTDPHERIDERLRVARALHFRPTVPILPSLLTLISALLPAQVTPTAPTTDTQAASAASDPPADLVFFAAGLETTAHDELGIGALTLYGQFGRRLHGDVWLTLRAGAGHTGGLIDDNAILLDLQLGAAYHRCAERWLCANAGVGVGHRRGASTDDENVVTDVRGVTVSARAGVELRVAGPLAFRFDGHATGMASFGETDSGVGYGFDAATLLRF